MTRPIKLLELEDRVVSQAIIWKLGPILDARLSQSVYSVRTTKNTKKPFRGWYQDWPDYQKHLQSLLEDESCVVISDITGYFDNIDLRILKDLLLRLENVEGGVVDIILFMLEAWMYRPLYGVPVGRGIPQAALDFPQALSNFFLYPHDIRMDSVSNDHYIRWMDDMNFVVSSRHEGIKVVRALEDSLRRMFLTPNSSNTISY